MSIGSPANICIHLKIVKLINNSHELLNRKHKRNHEREGVCISDTEIMLIYINFNFNFLTKYHSFIFNC